MRNRTLLMMAVVLGALLVPAPTRAETPAAEPAPANPLAPFERFIGARWHLEGSYLELEWGVGRRSVKSRSYFVVDGEPRLVSEGSWFWHPGERAIKGIFTAVDMPVAFFDYTVRFEEDQMVNDLEAYDAAGNGTSYVETWELLDETRFRWKLLGKTEEGLEELMGGVYTKEP